MAGAPPFWLEDGARMRLLLPPATVQPMIQQATCNILADIGVKPATPEGVVLDLDA